ncbi:MAG: ribosomal protein S18-alanine N-acetyltransferase [Candidatus Korobacteraceae bacterium]|jgi:ribosomal-protein-alanine acetyltransferase
MRIRAAVPQDIPRLIALERQADSAAHWGEQHYQAIFAGSPANAPSNTHICLADAGHVSSGTASSPKRVCLVVEIPSESPAGVKPPADYAAGAGENRLAVPWSPVVGFVVAQCAREEWEIENLVIDAGKRRRGLASRLLEQLLCHARDQGAKTVVLEVRESNQAARALYAKWGFREAGRRSNYYRDPEEAAILLTFSGGGSLVKSG